MKSENDKCDTFFNHMASGIDPEYINLPCNIVHGNIVDPIQYVDISCISDPLP